MPDLRLPRTCTQSGSKRSRLDFSNKEKEVGIAAAIHLEKYIKKQTTTKPTRTRRIVGKSPVKKLPGGPIDEILDADLGGVSDDDLEPLEDEAAVENVLDEEETDADEGDGGLLPEPLPLEDGSASSAPGASSDSD